MSLSTSAPAGIAFKLNTDLQETNAPPIPLAGAWVSKYAGAEGPIINLAQGVPGAPPPRELLDRLRDAAGDPATTSYGDLRGDISLRQALAVDINRVYGPGADVDCETEMALTAGCNLAFYAAVLTIAKAGDEVVLPTPFYFNQEMGSNLCLRTLTQLGISPAPLPCLPSDGFTPRVDAARALITDKTRAIVLVTPNNPTGAIYSDELLSEFARLAVEKGVALIVDETYREFLPTRPHSLFLPSSSTSSTTTTTTKKTNPDWRTYLIHLFSFSKSHAIPGHRLGAVVGPRAFMTQLYKTLDCLQICPARTAQVALTWAVEGTRAWRASVRDELMARQSLFRDIIEQSQTGQGKGLGNAWQVAVNGGYFAYLRHPYDGFSSEQVARRLGEHVGIVVLPGTFFAPKGWFTHERAELDRYIRFSVANVSSETLRLVPARLQRLNELWDSLGPA